MTKQWKPGRETVPLRPSRIRREPVQLQQLPTVVRARQSREREIWAAMLGVAIIAAAVVTIIVGASIGTRKGAFGPDAPAATPLKFDYCRGDRQQDCVLDGDTLFVGAEKIRIAGIDAPEARTPKCQQEAQLGVAASVRLRAILNGGTVSVQGAPAGRNSDGAAVRRVEVNGRDLGQLLVGAGVARELGGGERSWCA